MAIDIYNKEKQIERELNCLGNAVEDLASGILVIRRQSRTETFTYHITKANKDAILDFDRYLKVRCDNGPLRRVKVIKLLTFIADKLGKDFKDATTQDIESLAEWVLGKSSSAHTQRDYRRIIKRFWQWQRGMSGNEYPELVKWVHTGLKRNRIPPNSSQLLTEEDILSLIGAAETPRDKAMIATLWDTACRIQECLTLEWEMVRFDDKGGFVNLHGKTGANEGIRIVFAAPYLQTWRQCHPDGQNSSAPLWWNRSTLNKKKHITYHAACSIIRKAAEKISLNKPVNPHWIRKSRITFLRLHGMSDNAICKQASWVEGSGQLQNYSLQQSNKTEMERIYGIAAEEAHIAKAKPRLCERCKELNEATNLHCKRCGHILDLELAEMQRNRQTLINTITEKLLRELVDIRTEEGKQRALDIIIKNKAEVLLE